MMSKTPLHATHLSEEAKMVDFAGWDMPIEYTSAVAEIKAVRDYGGLFDVSHMGRIRFEGSDAERLLDFVLSCDVAALGMLRAKYNLLCDTAGGVIDDCIVYRTAPDAFLLIINAARHKPDMRWIETQRDLLGANVQIDDQTATTALIAVQGPQVVAKMTELTQGLASAVKRFAIASVDLGGHQICLARTGYTGEDGFEVVVDAEQAPQIWKILREVGFGACGLAARDVLRLEAGLLLYGNDMTQANNPYECGLGWTVKLDKSGEYGPREALQKLSTTGARLQGLVLQRGIPRRGMPIKDQAGVRQIGVITSGTYSPTIKKGIALALLDAPIEIGRQVTVDLRGRDMSAEITKPPFYQKEAK